jgi:hypothetical protein
MADEAAIAALAVTTAGVLLALASIKGAVDCSISDIILGAPNSRARSDPASDNEDDDVARLVGLLANEESAAVAALFGEGLLTNMQLFGRNMGDWYILPRSLTWFDDFADSVYDDKRWWRLFCVYRGTSST